MQNLKQEALSVHINDQVATSAGLEHQELFPIREVARLTGVNPVTLRAWERRYGLIQPTRTDSGHRLYSQADIDDIRSILGWLERGVAVSKVGSILARNQGVTQDGQGAGNAEELAGWRGQVQEATQRFDGLALERLFDQVFACHALDAVFDEVFMPVWRGLRAGQGSFGRVSEWLFLDQFLRGKVLLRLQLSRGPWSQRVVLAPLSGQCHELELLVAGLLLGSDEVGVTVLATGQPMEELALVCERLAPDALVMFSHQPPTQALGKRLARLTLGVECPVVLAGEVAELAQEQLGGSPVACLGAQGSLMRRRLRQYLAGQLDT
ncbi:MerR family transcriptional regulator [Pseudomonas guariconensis]|uniref:Helix-turn-helix-type transcriptional regulator n=1 Tax=Pseudomonas guariconensis TaxID=1288410 RepID=A0AAX0VXH0_9PSED|nr:MerR family transcriptional regulator [Pseudomonas guariconensis]PLV19347.1 helix-turn-helix-type transcriptional regulator [Pseudomonas guariconensis]PLV24020.1 helix-turn-helix-type transcriptional regulator [Pseudomonas guariconensis]PLV29043.1 helix-turn-helix-type transcriptional regulator [Pseudomonas guariconensis]